MVATEEEKVEDEVTVTTVAPPSTSTVFTAFGSSSSSSSASSPTSSVAEELFGDEESISNEVEPETKPFSSGPRSILSGFRKPRKWPSVKKAKVEIALLLVLVWRRTDQPNSGVPNQ